MYIGDDNYFSYGLWLFCNTCLGKNTDYLKKEKSQLLHSLTVFTALFSNSFATRVNIPLLYKRVVRFQERNPHKVSY